MAFLKIQTGERHGTVAPIQAANFTLGRGDDVELQVPDKGVSRRHAEVFRLGELHFVRDLGSRNGTFLDDARVAGGEASPLASGSRLRFGRESPAWDVASVDAPALMAVQIETGASRTAEGGYLVLPDGETAEYCIYQDPQDAWICEHRGDPRLSRHRAPVELSCRACRARSGEWPRRNRPTWAPDTIPCARRPSRRARRRPRSGPDAARSLP